MKSLRTLTMAAVAAGALALPIAACAQQAPASAPSQAPGAAGAWHGHHHRGMMGMMRSLNLSPDQQTKIRQIMQQYRQAHPRGSAPDRSAREQMRTQIMSVLTTQQQATLKSHMQQMRQRRRDGEAGAPQPQSTPQP